VDAEEALQMGLVNRLCEPGQALATALVLAEHLAALPQDCMRNDRLSVHEQEHLSLEDALANEFQRGLASLASPDFVPAVSRFVAGQGRGGAPVGER
jgi:enoyl-CoA hydratase